jgi:amylosucrase
VLAVLRQHPEGDLLALYNVTESDRGWPGARLLDLGFERVRDALSDVTFEVRPDADLVLGPYAAVWLVAESS